MDEIHKKALNQCRVSLVKNIIFESEFCDLIKQKEIFTDGMLEEIQANTSRRKRVGQLLDDLRRRGPDAYNKFLYCLENSGHRNLADAVKEKEKQIRNENQQPVLRETIHGAQHLQHSISAQPLLSPDPLSNMNSSQSAPNLASSGSIVASPSEDLQDITSRKEVQGNSNFQRETGYNEDIRMDVADHINPGFSNPLPGAESSRSSSSGGLGSYNITTDPRGIVLIINNINFVSNNENRHGAEIDQEKLMEMFRDFGFEIRVHIDKTAQEIEEILKYFSKDEQLLEVDSLIVVLMSHGNNEIILGTDGECKNIIDLITLFNSKNCTSMTGKPKMFIVNACRGDGRDKIFGKTQPVDVHDTVHTDGRGLSKQPANCDLLIAYSTFPGYVSFRDDKNGSPFVKCLVEVFREMAHLVHVLDMLTEVNNRMADSHNQIPNPTSTLRLKWHLM
ncbi:caspase-2-like [Mytilus californianus]|uniref:caspase-2-like n=1 Tax=Mytilus californianus TaxID=6549 RepID=UPI002247E264|nr:caspase-2-like [Mytilus californianus]